MSSNLAEVIFEQFIEIVKRLSHRYCTHIKTCDVHYTTTDINNILLIELCYEIKTRCSTKNVHAVINYTSICCDDLTTKSWRTYLKGIAKDFLSKIVGCDDCEIPPPEKKCRPRQVPCKLPKTKCVTIEPCICPPVPRPTPCKKIIKCTCYKCTSCDKKHQKCGCEKPTKECSCRSIVI